MKIAGIEKQSFVDYSGKIAFVIFTRGCNMNCFYCHNKGIINTTYESNKLYDTSKVMELLINRRRFLDGVVITGGEPTIQEDLEDFIIGIKELGYKVKLDTNGTNPEVIESLIHKNLVDYVAMDIKAPFDMYNFVCRTEVDISKIEKSINILLNGDVEYEFRTTFIPHLNFNDISVITDKINNADLYVLQQLRSNFIELEKLDSKYIKKPYDPIVIEDAVSRLTGKFKNVMSRGV